MFISPAVYRLYSNSPHRLGRVCPELLARKSVVVLDDEAHHCYQQKPGDPDEAPVEAEGREGAKKNAEAARLWINGIRALGGKVNLRAVYDVSATPFFPPARTTERVCCSLGSCRILR